MIIIEKARRKTLLVLNGNLGFPEKRKLYPVRFIVKAQCVEFGSTMQWLDEINGVSFYC